VGDIDGDGENEIIYTDSYGFINAVKYSGEMFRGPSYVPSASHGTEMLLFDINNDNRLEAVSFDGNIVVVSGDKGQSIYQQYAFQMSILRKTIMVADLDNDGKYEIISTGTSDFMGSDDYADETKLLWSKISCMNVSGANINDDMMIWPASSHYFNSRSSLDEYEINDTFDRATRLTDYSRPILSYVWREGDEDYYKINVKEQTELNVTLRSIPKDCNYDLYLYNGNRDEVGASKNDSNKNESVSLKDAQGIYYVRVSPVYGHSLADPYTLIIQKGK
jgi:hypothetical protein